MSGEAGLWGPAWGSLLGVFAGCDHRKGVDRRAGVLFAGVGAVDMSLHGDPLSNMAPPENQLGKGESEKREGTNEKMIVVRCEL